MSTQTKLYLIGSLRNKRIPLLANKLREEMPDIEVFDDWYSAGPEADDYWKEYEQSKGIDYQTALKGYAARHVFEFDKHHLDTSSHVLLVLPAGKSGHMEVMYAQYGTDAHTAILLDPENVRWDVMYQFIPTILNNDKEIKTWLNSTQTVNKRANPEASSTQGSPKSPGVYYTTSREQFNLWPACPSSEHGNIYGTDGSLFPMGPDDIQKPQ